MVTRVKICGLTRREDAMLAIELGAHALGFIFEPSSKRFLTEVPAWIVDLPPYVARVAVFGHAPAAFVPPLFHAVQGACWPLAQKSNDAFHRIAAVPCGTSTNLAQVLDTAIRADAILLDAHAEGQYGGTGKTIDWNFAAEVVRACPKPVILAGGLTPDNVAEAIRKVRPFAVDVSSGVEAEPGVKDPRKLKAFFQAIQTNVSST